MHTLTNFRDKSILRNQVYTGSKYLLYFILKVVAMVPLENTPIVLSVINLVHSVLTVLTATKLVQCSILSNNIESLWKS